MTLKEHAAVKALVAEGMRQDHAVQRVISERKMNNHFDTIVRKRG